jgi:hypothetical protein
MRTRLGIIVLLIAGGSTSATAQRRIYYSLSRPTPILFQTPTSADLARTLTGGTLHSTAVPSVATKPAIDSAVASVSTCPMPVLAADSAHIARMPVLARDSVAGSTMPVMRPSCVNPLRR